jgi:hypothetical protein
MPRSNASSSYEPYELYVEDEEGSIDDNYDVLGLDDFLQEGEVDDYRLWEEKDFPAQTAPKHGERKKRPSIPLKKGRDWNGTFQHIMEDKDPITRGQALENFSEDFVRVATRCAQTIILESALPNELKTGETNTHEILPMHSHIRS